MILLTPFTTVFLTGHGPFGAYLFKFKRTPFPLCEFSDVSDASHYFNICLVRVRWHIRHLPVLPNGLLANILTRPTLLSKITNFFKFLCDLSVLIHHWDRCLDSQSFSTHCWVETALVILSYITFLPCWKKKMLHFIWMVRWDPVYLYVFILAQNKYFYLVNRYFFIYYFWIHYYR